jgi:serine/threonine-protein kinase
MPAAAGRRLGRYVMFEEIARGEMGALHLGCALDPDARRPVAIKHLYPWLAANSSYATTYLREARLAARIRHPNVARTTDVITGPVNGELYLVMDYVHGDTLAHLLSQARRLGAGPPLEIVAGIMAGLLRGLHAVQEATRAEDFPAQHAQREVSPQDVIVGLDGVTRIFEFGAVNLAHGHMRELVSGRGADVFSAGAMLWEILAGRRLFGDPADRDVFLTSATNLTPPPSHFNPGVPPELDAVVLRALRKDRDRRYLSAQAFADAIEAAVPPATTREIGDWVARTSTHLLAERAVRVAGITRTSRGPAPARPVGVRPWSPPRSRRRTAAAIAVAVAGALIGAGLWARGSENQRAADRPPLVASMVVERPRLTNLPGPGAAPAEIIAPAPAETVATAAPAEVPEAAPVKVAPAAARAKVAPAASMVAPAASSWQRRQAGARGSRTGVARVARLNRAALKAYRRMDPITARRWLHAALAECARSGLGRHPIAARTHAILGVVLAGGFKQAELGAEQFKSALRIDPRVPVPPRYASEADVAAAFRVAVAAGDLRN